MRSHELPTWRDAPFCDVERNKWKDWQTCSVQTNIFQKQKNSIKKHTSKLGLNICLCCQFYVQRICDICSLCSQWTKCKVQQLLLSVTTTFCGDYSLLYVSLSHHQSLWSVNIISFVISPRCLCLSSMLSSIFNDFPHILSSSGNLSRLQATPSAGNLSVSRQTRTRHRCGVNDSCILFGAPEP